MIKKYIFSQFSYRLSLLLLVFVGTADLGHAQFYNQRKEFLNANNIWAFGRQAGLDFSTNPPGAFQSASNSFESCATFASPSTGKLLFYSQGNSCFNRNHRPMPNGTGLLGNPFNMGLSADGGTTQGVCITPTLEKTGQYYLFSLGDIMSNTGKLYYSVVDTSLDNNLGDVVPTKKNILLDDLLSESMIAIPGNNCDLWLLVHDRTKAQFKAYHITNSGLNKIPIISNVGSNGRYAMGSMAISPDRKMLAMGLLSASVLPSNTVIGLHLLNFNAETGVVSNSTLTNLSI